METDTLARRLGTTAHISPLLMKARRLGLRVPEDLCTLAVQRGCRYYAGGGDMTTVVREEPTKTLKPVKEALEFSNEELALALLSLSLPYSQHRLRAGAAMLGAENNSPQRLAEIAKHERCETVVRYIGECGRQVEPENAFWQALLQRLPDVPPPPVDTLPHITRFVAMTGFTRYGRKTVMQWIRPAQNPAA